MRKVFRHGITVLCFLVFISPVHASTTPTSLIEQHVQSVLNKIASIKMKEFQQLTGRKLNFKEKLGFIVLKHQVKKGNGDKIAESFVKKIYYKKNSVKDKYAKKAEGGNLGKMAFIFGIAGLVLLVTAVFVPVLFIPSIVSAILAVVLGTVGKKENPSDSKAAAGKLMGWITLGLLALLLLVIVIAFANTDWGWG